MRAPRLLREAARRRLAARGGPWRRADGMPYRALVVADVDLDQGDVRAYPPLTAFESEPEGVHALVWLHGEPIGCLTVAGTPQEVLRTLVETAHSKFSGEVREHQIRDALLTPGGVREAMDKGLAALQHPSRLTSGPQITVAVCTRDRPADLERCLTSIMDLRGDVSEVLVIDNASADDATRSVAARFPSVRYIREPRRGLDWARNRSLLEATAEVVAFADDDVLVHPGWVDGIRQVFVEEPAAVAMTGLVVPAELASAAQIAFELEGGFGRGFRRLYFAADVARGEVAARRHAAIGGAGTGANMAFRREPTLALGGFDPALDVGTLTGGCGDLEMFFRVVSAGHLLVYEPAAVVRHRHRSDLQGLIRQRRGDGTGSYSWLVGAGRHYGWTQYRQLLRFAAWWTWHHHMRSRASRWLLPEAWAPGTKEAETRGAIDAILGRYYRRAESVAVAEAAARPDEPTAPPLLRPDAERGHPKPRVDKLEIDVLEQPPLGISRLGLVDGRAMDVIARISYGGEHLADLRVETHGSPLSTARLVRELARALPSEPFGDSDGDCQRRE